MVRLKTRYLLVEVAPAANARKLAVQKEDVASLIKESIARNYGDYGVGLLQYAFQGACLKCTEMTGCMMACTHRVGVLTVLCFAACRVATSALFQQVHAVCGGAVCTRAVQISGVVAGVCDRVPKPRSQGARRTSLW